MGETLQNSLINECESGRKLARNTQGKDSSCIGKTLRWLESQSSVLHESVLPCRARNRSGKGEGVLLLKTVEDVSALLPPSRDL